MFPWDFAWSAEAMFSCWAIKRVCKFLLKKKLRELILGDIDLDHLKVHIIRGTIQLSYLAVNVDYINQKEEQKVIEAQIRVRHQEIQNEQERMKRWQEISSSEVEHNDNINASLSVSSQAYLEQEFGFVSTQSLSTLPADTRSHIRRSREDHFDMDLEDLMVMEAIWLSIQEQGPHRNRASPRLQDFCAAAKDAPHGLACTVAALAERQLAGCGGAPPIAEAWLDAYEGSSASVPPTDDGECSVDNCSEIAEAGTSYAGSDIAADTTRAVSLRDGVNMAAGHLLPESFEEQMMLAMAVSLAEARARANPQGLTWM